MPIKYVQKNAQYLLATVEIASKTSVTATSHPQGWLKLEQYYKYGQGILHVLLMRM